MQTSIAARLCPAQKVLSIASVVAISLFVAACGGGGDGSSNSGPAAVADSFAVNVGQSLPQPPPGVLANDNGATQAELVTPPAHHTGGVFTLNPDGSFTYTHNSNTAISDSFTYRVINNGQPSAPATVSITINQPPTAQNRCTSIQDSESSIGVTLPTNDPNGSNTIATYTLEALTSGTIVECGTYPCVRSSPFLTYVPGTVRGMAKLRFNVSDSGGLNAAQPSTVTILRNGELRVMPLGDSITLGLYLGSTPPNTPAPNDRISYRRKLFNDILGLNPGHDLRFVGSLTNGNDPNAKANNHEGHDGLRTDQLASGIAGWLTQNPPDIVLVHAGTNGVDADPSPTGQAVTGMNDLLNNVNSWASTNYGSNSRLNVFVARMIPATDGSRDAETYNNNVSNNINTVSRPNLTVFKVNQQTGSGINLSGQANHGNPDFYAEPLHPNQDGYNLMAVKWLTDLQASGAMPVCQ
jgi:lysophospholipase L1-like esterase